MSFLDIYSLTFFVHNNFKKHCNSSTEISHYFSEYFAKSQQKYKKLYVFKVDLASLNQMKIPVCHGSNIKSFNKIQKKN